MPSFLEAFYKAYWAELAATQLFLLRESACFYPFFEQR